MCHCPEPHKVVATKQPEMATPHDYMCILCLKGIDHLEPQVGRIGSRYLNKRILEVRS